MKYTKGDIPGMIFESMGVLYRCLGLKEDKVVMEYVNDKLGYKFINNIKTTLDYFNSGTWKIQNKEIIYELY